MSRCPDALLCETLFDQVNREVGSRVDLELVYIAKYDSDNSTHPECMHGHDECAGNIQQLCVKKHAEDLAQWWSFVQCQNYEGRLRIGLPSVATKCARSARLEWEKSGAAECVGEKYGGGEKSGDGQEGRLLLKKSVETQQKEDIVKSCTILIDHEKVCVHDGVWKDCDDGHTVNDFVRQIKSAYDRLNASD